MLRKDIKKYQEDDDKVHLHLVLKGFSSFREEQKHCQKERESYSSYLDMPAKKRREIFFSKSFYTNPENGGYNNGCETFQVECLEIGQSIEVN